LGQGEEKEKETKRSEKRAAEEVKELARDQARRKDTLAREQAIAEAQEAKKLKAKNNPQSEPNGYGQGDSLCSWIFSNSCLNSNTPAYAYLNSRPGKADYLLVKLAALVYNVSNSFGLGYYKLLKIPLDLSST